MADLSVQPRRDLEFTSATLLETSHLGVGSGNVKFPAELISVAMLWGWRS
jgi:hypothetical protein